jgi:hypothetical protein
MLNREICEKCIDKNREKGTITYNEEGQLILIFKYRSWESKDNCNWYNDKINCPVFIKSEELGIGTNSSFMMEIEKSHETAFNECPYKLEHLLKDENKC